MNIKTYQAATMQEALKQIKAELGPDAVILSTRQVRATSGTLALLGRHLVEVTAAVDPAPTGRMKASGPVAATSHPDRSFRTTLGKELAYPPAPPSIEDLQNEVGRLREMVERLVIADPPASGPGISSCRNLDLTTGVNAGPASTGVAAGPEPDAWLEQLPLRVASSYRMLVGRGLPAEHAKRLVSSLHEQASPRELASDSAVRGALRGLLASEIHVGGPVLGPQDRKKTVILVGPTGAGKTTSIAKLAAHYSLIEKRRVVLITLDTYRMAAVEQLRAYARLLNVPLEVALTKADALTFIRGHEKAELVLIDTTGRSPRDQAGMSALKGLLNLDHRVETHLVLSAPTRQRDLLDAVGRFSDIPLHRLLFTKLDETSSYGAILAVGQKTRLPLSYLGIGQEVPDDLMLAQPERLADLVLGGALPPTKRGEALGVRREEDTSQQRREPPRTARELLTPHASPLTS
jgi:flagellar biosynthesis protein FlhF